MASSNEATTAVLDMDALSRQLPVYDMKGSLQLSSARILLQGLSVVGVEIAKNLVLAGIKALVLSDPRPADHLDLAGQFYISENDVTTGKSKAACSVSHLSNMNPSVAVSLLPFDICLDPFASIRPRGGRHDHMCGGDSAECQHSSLLDGFDAVVVTDATLDDAILINDVCRSVGVRFVYTSVRGVCGNIFVDFGECHEVYDCNGELIIEIMVGAISNANPAVVTSIQHYTHDLSSGDCVTFRGVNGGMGDLLNGNRFKVIVINSHQFYIDVDTCHAPLFTGTATATLVKLPVTYSFQSMRDLLTYSMKYFVCSDDNKFAYMAQLHLVMRALGMFQRMKGGRLPAAWHDGDAKILLQCALDINDNEPVESRLSEVDVSICRKVAFTAVGCLPSLAAFIGGYAAQEVLKGVSGKFTPLQQWFYSDVFELLPNIGNHGDFNMDDVRLRGLPSDGQAICLGNTLQTYLEQVNLFIVGAGAIGCELLKNIAMMGACLAASLGEVSITDSDVIEKSNLNRQFLFRHKDIQCLKSQTAANAVRKMAPNMNVVAYAERLGVSSESLFSDKYFESKHCILTALDNVEARLYTDQRCILSNRPLLESGTMSTKGHVQVIIPHVSEPYSATRDPVETDIPMCTLKTFPNHIEHCVQWAKTKFEEIYYESPREFNNVVSDSALIMSLTGDRSMSAITSNSNSPLNFRLLKQVVKLLDYRPSSWRDCVKYARILFDKFFNYRIQQLLRIFPADTQLKSGALFWSLPKRLPTPLVFNCNSHFHLDFIAVTASVWARIHGVAIGVSSYDSLQQICESLYPELPLFCPKDSKNIVTDETVKDTQNTPVSHDKSQAIITRLKLHLQTQSLSKLHPEDFNKDDDKNGHIQFIHLTSLLRAEIYGIPAIDLYMTKVIAGKIIPAVATTTSVVSALVVIELIKLLRLQLALPSHSVRARLSSSSLSMFKNTFLNLALPVLQMSEPLAPKIYTAGSRSFTVWDHWDFDVPVTVDLGAFVKQIETWTCLRVLAINKGPATIFHSSLPLYKSRLSKTLLSLLKVEASIDVRIPLVITLTESDGKPVKCPLIRVLFLAFVESIL